MAISSGYRCLKTALYYITFIGMVGSIASCGGSTGTDKRETTDDKRAATNSLGVENDGKRDNVELRFGVYTSDQPKVMVEQFRPVLNAIQASMTESLQVPVSITTQVSSTYEDGIGDLVGGHVDFSRFGPASYTMVKEQHPDVSLLAVEQVKGGRIFYGIICVHDDSDFKSCADLRGRSFAFGDDKSTIGRYLSQEYLLKCGIRASDLSKYDYLNRHDRVGDAVVRKEYDAGALKEGTFSKMVASGAPLRELTRFPNVTKPWVVRPGLDPAVEEALRQALLQMDDESALAALKKSGFEAGDDADYDPIRAAIGRNDQFFTEN